MWITPAYAQDAAGTATTTTAAAPAATDISQYLTLAPILLIFVVMYFLLIRPQQKKQRAHQSMIKEVRRGDSVITTGGIIGRIVKVVDDNELELEIAKETRVRVMRAAIAEVRSKGEPVKEEA